MTQQDKKIPAETSSIKTSEKINILTKNNVKDFGDFTEQDNIKKQNTEKIIEERLKNPENGEKGLEVLGALGNAFNEKLSELEKNDKWISSDKNNGILNFLGLALITAISDFREAGNTKEITLENLLAEQQVTKHEKVRRSLEILQKVFTKQNLPENSSGAIIQNNWDSYITSIDNDVKELMKVPSDYPEYINRENLLATIGIAAGFKYGDGIIGKLLWGIGGFAGGNFLEKMGADENLNKLGDSKGLKEGGSNLWDMAKNSLFELRSDVKDFATNDVSLKEKGKKIGMFTGVAIAGLLAFKGAKWLAKDGKTNDEKSAGGFFKKHWGKLALAAITFFGLSNTAFGKEIKNLIKDTGNDSSRNSNSPDNRESSSSVDTPEDSNMTPTEREKHEKLVGNKKLEFSKYYKESFAPCIDSWIKLLRDLGAKGDAKNLVSRLEFSNFERFINDNNIVQEAMKDCVPDIRFPINWAKLKENVKNTAIYGAMGIAMFYFLSTTLKGLNNTVISKLLSKKVLIGGIAYFSITNWDSLDDETKEKTADAYESTKILLSDTLLLPGVREAVKRGGNGMQKIKEFLKIGEFKDISENEKNELIPFLNILQKEIRNKNFQKESIEFHYQKKVYNKIIHILKNLKRKNISIIDRGELETILNLSRYILKKEISVEKKNNRYSVKMGDIKLLALSFNPHSETLPLAEVPQEQTNFQKKQLQKILYFIETQKDEYKKVHSGAITLLKAEIAKYENGYTYTQYTKNYEKTFLNTLQKTNKNLIEIEWNGYDYTREIIFKNANGDSQTFEIPRAELSPEIFLKYSAFMGNSADWFGFEMGENALIDTKNILTIALAKDIIENSPKESPIAGIAQKTLEEIDRTGTSNSTPLIMAYIKAPEYNASIKNGALEILKASGEQLFIVPIQVYKKELSKIWTDEDINWKEIVRESYLYPIGLTLGGIIGVGVGLWQTKEGKSRMVSAAVKGARGVKRASGINIVTGTLRHPTKYPIVRGKNILTTLKSVSIRENWKAKRIVEKIIRINREIDLYTYTNKNGKKKSDLFKKGYVEELRGRRESLQSDLEKTNHWKNNKEEIEKDFKKSRNKINKQITPETPTDKNKKSKNEKKKKSTATVKSEKSLNNKNNVLSFKGSSAKDPKPKLKMTADGSMPIPAKPNLNEIQKPSPEKLTPRERADKAWGMNSNENKIAIKEQPFYSKKTLNSEISRIAKAKNWTVAKTEKMTEMLGKLAKSPIGKATGKVLGPAGALLTLYTIAESETPQEAAAEIVALGALWGIGIAFGPLGALVAGIISIVMGISEALGGPSIQKMMKEYAEKNPEGFHDFGEFLDIGDYINDAWDNTDFAKGNNAYKYFSDTRKHSAYQKYLHRNIGNISEWNNYVKERKEMFKNKIETTKEKRKNFLDKIAKEKNEGRKKSLEAQYRLYMHSLTKKIELYEKEIQSLQGQEIDDDWKKTAMTRLMIEKENLHTALEKGEDNTYLFYMFLEKFIIRIHTLYNMGIYDVNEKYHDKKIKNILIILKNRPDNRLPETIQYLIESLPKKLFLHGDARIESNKKTETSE